MSAYSPVAMKVATAHATELRKRLEANILEQVQQFQAATGLTPARIDLDITRVGRVDGEERLVLDRVRVVVEV